MTGAVFVFGAPYGRRKTHEQPRQNRDKSTTKNAALRLSRRDKTGTKVRQKTEDLIVSRQSEAYAENADIAERIRMKLLERLEREIDALPESIGTRLSRDGKECKLRDLTGAYLDLTRDAPDAAKTGDFYALDEVDYGE